MSKTTTPTRTFRDTNGNERHTNDPKATPRRNEREVKKPKPELTTGQKNKYAR